MSNTHITLTKLVIETQSPMAISTGRRETGFDTQLARDVNGLPTIPATAIAGVWSHLVKDCFGEQERGRWFGSTNKNKAHASVITISDATMLNSKGNPVERFTSQDEMEKDDILALCLDPTPLHRERVSINDRGVALEGGKFDQVLLPKGARFALTLQWSNQRDLDDALTPERWEELLSLWNSPIFAFGSSTRNGLGRIKVVHSEEKTFELRDKDNASSFAKYRQAPTLPFNRLESRFSIPESDLISHHIKLKALDNWRCGHGIELLTAKEKQPETSVNILTYSEKVIEWNNQNHGVISKQPRPVLCGSSIKGILAHRIAFHYRRHQKRWAETMADATHEEWQQRPEELKELLGFASQENHEESLAGSLWVEDSPISYTDTVIRHHNSIDRFTGGVRKGALYSEELLHQPRFELRLHIKNGIDETLMSAFNDTLRDIELGILPMGTGSGRGTSLVVKDEDVA